jgi:ABC-type antimicrobial peptide transport system permease subunit
LFSILSRFRALWANLFRRERIEHELDAEVGGYARLLEEENMRQGMKPEEAHRAARLELGGSEQVKEEVRGVRAGAWLEALWQDLRFAVRVLRKNPGFTVVAVLTLAIGIGANVGVFSVVNGVLLNPLPYPHPEQLVALHESKPNFATGSIPFLNFQNWRKENRTFSGMILSRGFSYNLTGSGEPERLQARLVSAPFFSVLGVNPVIGRDFAPGEDSIGAAPYVMISSSLWQRKFGASPGILGRSLRLDDRDYTIIGVVPAGFDLFTRSFNNVDLYVPLGQWSNKAIQYRGAGLGLHGFGRLRPGVTIEQARADMAGVTNALASEYPDVDKDTGASIIPLRQEMLGSVRPILLILLGAVVFVLLIACVNVGNLLLARANGAGLGLAIATWGTRAVLRVLPMNLPRASEVGLDGRVLAFTFGLSLLCGILFGLAPAVKIARSDLHATLKEGGRGSSGAKHRAQGVFVALEMAMALVLLIGAGLMIRSLSALWSVNPGFQADGVLHFGLSYPVSLAKAPLETIRATLRETESRFAAVPGVSSVSLSWGALPMWAEDDEGFWLQGQPKPASESDMYGYLDYIVGPDYLKTMHIPLLRGRFFTSHDDTHAPTVVVIDESLARQYFGNQDPIGRRLEFETRPTEAEIIGVVGHVKQWGLDGDAKQKLQAQIYLPMLQQDGLVMPLIVPGVDVVVRCATTAATCFDGLRRANSDMNAEQVIYGFDSMNEIIAGSLAERRFSMILLGAFAACALVLAMIGVYGVMSYSVGRRTNEIGMRIALGAPRGNVFRLVLGEGLRLAAIGAVAGIVCALLLARLLSSLLFGISAHDPLTFAAVAVLLGAVAALACWIPAYRAMRVDPMVALRHE